MFIRIFTWLALIFMINFGKFTDAHPIKVIYLENGCECAKNLPYNVENPKEKYREQKFYEHGYNIEVPQVPSPETTYSFDFQFEQPKFKLEKQRLYSGGYKVEVPKKPENERLYQFDYNVEVPYASIETRKPSPNLVAKLDGILLPGSDCPQPGYC